MGASAIGLDLSRTQWMCVCESLHTWAAVFGEMAEKAIS